LASLIRPFRAGCPYFRGLPVAWAVARRVLSSARAPAPALSKRHSNLSFPFYCFEIHLFSRRFELSDSMYCPSQDLIPLPSWPPHSSSSKNHGHRNFQQRSIILLISTFPYSPPSRIRRSLSWVSRSILGGFGHLSRQSAFPSCLHVPLQQSASRLRVCVCIDVCPK